MKHLLTLNPEHATESEIAAYPIREAARAIVKDKDGKIALLHVTKKGYYKLPGGGIDPGEDQLTALKRECREEIGCEVEVVGEVGEITEYRKVFKLTQISYCYLAQLVGEKGVPELMPDEVEDGFEVVWVTYEDAVAMAEASFSEEFEAMAYMLPRDVAFLKCVIL